MRLPRRLALTLEGEAGLNDPIAVMLVVVMVEVIRSPGYSPLDAVWFLAHELVVGLVAGLVVGGVAAAALRRGTNAPTGLPLVASFATAAVAFGAAGTVGGSGFLAVYVAGLVLAGFELPERAALTAFHEGLAAVAEIGMFFTLGLLVFPSQLGRVLVRGTVLALVVAVLARWAVRRFRLLKMSLRVKLGIGHKTKCTWLGMTTHSSSTQWPAISVELARIEWSPMMQSCATCT